VKLFDITAVMKMSPPPYSRTSTQPYQRHLTDINTPKNQDNPTSADLSVTSQQWSSAVAGGRMSSSNLCSTLLPDSAQHDNTFEVCIKRNSLGLGFSITGGVEAPAPWTNLIRIKKIFPLQPAWETGKLKIGDVILLVSGVPVSGLSLRQALDILRTSPPSTKLLVCRIPDPVTSSNLNSSPNNPRHRSSVVRSYSYGPYNVNTWQNWRTDQDLKSFANLSLNTDPVGNSDLLNSAGESMEIDISPSTPEKEWSPPHNSHPPQGPHHEEGEVNTLHLLKPIEDTLRSQSKIIGEFSVTLTKVKGSLGFSLSSTDDTVLNHSIKAILRDPALSDGRIQAGDKLVSANGVDLSTYSHQELIMFLRQCEETVNLGLFRDASRSGTPLDADSPPLPTSRDGSLTRKHLRYEAKELVRSLQSSRTSLEKAGLAGSKPGSYCGSGAGTLGRRRVRQFSPANQSRLAPFHHNNSMYPGSGGVVESPTTPLNSSAPPSLGLNSGLNLSVGAGLNTKCMENNNCDQGILCIQELDSGGGFMNENESDYQVSTPGGGGIPTTPGGGGYTPGGMVVSSPSSPVPRLYLHQATPPPRANPYFACMEDANRNSVPRTNPTLNTTRENTPPLFLNTTRENTPPLFLTNEQSRSLPRGIPLFSTPDPEKADSFRRPTDLNLNKDAKKRQGFYFSPAKF